MKMSMIWGIMIALCSFLSCQDQKREESLCGNGRLDPGEECDLELGVGPCEPTQFYHADGSVSCTSDCRFDFSDCGGRCGDGFVDAEHGELCDGENLGGRTCITLGYSDGTLTCSADCRSLEEGGCVRSCGDGELDEAEACDDGNLRHGDGCSGSCVVEAGWTCESSAPSRCQAVCMDGLAVGPEACDQEDLRGQTCQSQGFHGGTLACSPTCQLDLAPCELVGRCGDGIVQEAYQETCDPALELEDVCRGQGFFFGNPTCSDQCLLQPARCGNAFLWGTDTSDDGMAVAVDGSGNVYVAGGTLGELVAGGTCGSFDMFLTKFGPDMSLLWSRQFGSVGWDTATGVVIDSFGDVYVSGIVNGSFDGQVPLGNNDVSLVKFSADGVKLWSRQFGSVRHDQSDGLVVDAAGDLLVVGGMQYLPDGQPDMGQYDALLLKVDPAGTLLWSKHWGGVDHDLAQAIAVDPLGNILVTGVTENSMSGQTGFGAHDIFLSKLDPDGEELWTRIMGTASWDYGYGVISDETGNIYITGHVSGAVDGQTCLGQSDAFLSKWSPGGERLWTRLFGALAHDQGTALVMGADGRIHVVGWTEGSLDGNTAHGMMDGFRVVFNGQGQKLSSEQWGVGYDDTVNGLAIDGRGLILLTGGSLGPLQGQNGPGGGDAYLMIFNN